MADNVTSELEPKKWLAIEQLLLTGNISKAATAAGVNRKTIYEWLKQDTFKLALKEAEAEAMDNLSRRLVALADKAAEALEKVLENKRSNVNHRLKASSIVLANLLKIRELVDLEARVLALESAQNRGSNEKS